jgi:hypothetical protein
LLQCISIFHLLFLNKFTCSSRKIWFDLTLFFSIGLQYTLWCIFYSFDSTHEIFCGVF